MRPVEVRAMPLCGTGLRRRKYGESGFARTALRFKAGSWPATVRRGRSVCCGVAGFRRRPWAPRSKSSFDNPGGVFPFTATDEQVHWGACIGVERELLE